MLVDTSVHEALVTRMRRGQRATVRVDAYPDRVFSGHVEQVATFAAQEGWFSADVKVFTMKVAIDEVVEGLRPGMSAEVTIEIGNWLKQMLTVPVEALAGSVEMGNRRHCYVLTPDGVEEREVVVGLSDTQMVEIKEGLCEGDEVVLNPREPAATPSKRAQAPCATTTALLRRRLQVPDEEKSSGPM